MRQSLPDLKFRKSKTPLRCLSFLTAFTLMFSPLVPASMGSRRTTRASPLLAAVVRQADARGAASETSRHLPKDSFGLAAMFAPQITATKTDAFPDQDADGRAEPGDTITYSVTITNNGASDATGVVFNDPLDPNTTFVPGSLQATPLAINDSYATVGNVRLSIPTAGLLNNDADPDGGVLTASAGASSAQGGNVSVNSDGSFTYNPPPGFEGADSFTYTATDAQGNTDTATVSINVSGMIWFVDSSAGAGGDGRLTSPFNALTGAGSFDALAADDAGDAIFLYSGSYTGGLTLQTGQKLIGQGASESLAQAIAITPPSGTDPLPSTGGASPVITSGSNGVNLGFDNHLAGFTVGDTSGADIAGANFGTLTVRDVNLDGTGQALNLDTGNLDAGFGTVNVNNRTTTGLFLNAVGGTATFGATSIPNLGAAGGNAIHVQNSSADIAFASVSISDANQTSPQLDADLNSIPDNDGDGNSIFLSNNNGSFAVNGGVISNSGNDGIDARNSSNLILSNVTISAPGQDVTGATGAGTGGHAVQAINLTGASSINGSTITQFNVAGRDGLRLVNTTTPTAMSMTVDNSTFSNASGGNGIFISGRDEADMSLVVQNNNQFTGLAGEAISHTAGSNAGSTATVNLTVKGSIFQNAAAGGLNTVTARTLEGGKAAILIEDNTFTNVARTASSNTGVITVNGDATLGGNSQSITIKGNTIHTIGDAVSASRRAIQIFIDDNTNVAGNIVIDSNTVTSVRRSALLLDMNNISASGINALITNNTFGTTAAPVGLAGQSAVNIFRRRVGGASANVLMHNNTIVNNASGTATSTNTTVFARAEDNANLSLTATGNTITNLGTTIPEFRADTNFAASGSPTLCLDMSGNTLDSNTGIIRLHEIVGALNVAQSSAAALASDNGLTAANVVTGAGTPNFGVACAAPPVAMFNPNMQRQHLASGANNALRTTAGQPVKAPALTHASLLASSGSTAKNLTNDIMRAGEARQSRLTNAFAAFRYAAMDASVGLGAWQAEREARRAAQHTATASALMPVVFAGETVNVTILTLPAGKSVTIKFEATINNPVTAAEVSNQGKVTGTNFADVLTDDPDTAATGDPTKTSVGAPPAISCPANINVDSDPNAFSASVPFTVTSTGTPAPTVECKAGANVITSPHTFPVGTTTVQCTAANGIAPDAACSFTVTVNDAQTPVISCPSDIVVNNDADSCAANVNVAPATATDNDPNVGVSGVRSDGQPLNAPYPQGTTTITWTATDVSGLTASDTQAVTVKDTQAPVISCPANIVVSLPLNSAATGVAVNYNVTATDTCGGANVTSNIASGSVFPLGTTTVTSTATDAAGNAASCSFTVTVLYNFKGFFSPVENLPVINMVKAGKTIPIKFSLNGNRGLNIFAPGYPASGAIACNSGDPAVDLTAVDAPGNSGLTYDAATDQYHYNWKTLKAWEGTCRQLVVRLNDGSEYRANFNFK